MVLEATVAVNDFTHQAHSRVINAAHGSPGMGTKRAGRTGPDSVIKVPVGTVVMREGYTGVLAELDQAGQRLVLARGGRGGRGNKRFATSINQAPREFEAGTEGERITVVLDLKMIADVGIMGLPNAGKSTLLHILTGAQAKIADYPFTTLAPNIGVLVFEDYEEAVLADIPGLIEHASQGAGLGNRFLKHVERTKLLVHVIECRPAEGAPIVCYRMLRQELEAFGVKVAGKDEIVVLNKIDAEPDHAEALASFAAAGLKAWPVSARTGAGTGPLKDELRRRLVPHLPHRAGTAVN